MVWCKAAVSAAETGASVDVSVCQALDKLVKSYCRFCTVIALGVLVTSTVELPFNRFLLKDCTTTGEWVCFIQKPFSNIALV